MSSVSPRGIRPRTVGSEWKNAVFSLAVALSLLVLTAYSMLFPPTPAGRRLCPRRSRAERCPGGRRRAGGSPACGRPGRRRPRPRRRQPAPRSRRWRTRRSVGSRSCRPRAQVTFSNKGARLLSWQLARFKDQGGHPEEMVQAVVGGPRPLDLETGDPALDARLQGGPLPASAETLQVPARGPAVLRFEYRGRRDPGREEPYLRGRQSARRAERAGVPSGPGPSLEDPLGAGHRQPDRRREGGPGLCRPPGGGPRRAAAWNDRRRRS